jgi:Zn-dependent peptidase ImmA (M78 family)/plasmid maintenance system antidote protein VapI
MNLVDTFNPDWVSPPGDTIRDALIYKNLSTMSLCRALDISADAAERLLRGDIRIDPAIADGLANALGASRQFWLSRESYYRARLEQKTAALEMMDFATFVKALPLNDMKAFGWLEVNDGLSHDKAVERFFEDTPGGWRQSGPQMMEAVRFRTSPAHESNPASVAAWLRKGVLQAREITCAPWSPEALADAVSEIRALSRVKAPAKFFPKLVDLCRSCGVAVVFVRTPKGCRASGATHFASDDKAIIQLSFRYRSDDHFWFTMFHEIAHLVLHQGMPLFVEGREYEITEEETEANVYAARVLIPEIFEPNLGSVARDFRAVMRLARRIGVSSGIVVGQMQKRGLLRHDQFNFLKTRYDWDELGRIIL